MRWKMDEEKTGKAMLRAGLDVYTLSKEIGATAKTVTNAVSGKSIPSPATVKKIADRLGVDPVALCVPYQRPGQAE